MDGDRAVPVGSHGRRFKRPLLLLLVGLPIVLVGSCALIAVIAVSMAPPFEEARDLSSSDLPSLEQKKEVLERYVSFQRSYEELEFEIHSGSRGGLLPSPDPTPLDVRLRAVVPRSEQRRWLRGMPDPRRRPGGGEAHWAEDLGVDLKALRNFRWSIESKPQARFKRIVGIDAQNSVVLYRLCTPCELSEWNDAP